MFEKRIYLKSQQPKPSNKFDLIKLFLLIVIFIFTINTFANLFIYSSITGGSLLVSPLATDIIQKTVSFINSQENSKPIEEIVDKVLDGGKNNYGIVIRNLKTGERYYLNEDKVFDSASLYKLWIMAVVYEQLDQGEVQENDVLSDSVEDLNEKFNISSSSAEFHDGTITTSVKNALENMIDISDNYSAMILTQKVGLATVSQFLNDNDFNDSKIGTAIDNPKTSAKDIASFFDKLYHDQLNDSSDSVQMLDLLKKQQLNGKIPKYIPTQVEIAHKTGELDNVSHDAGIVYGPRSSYIIVVMSSTDNPSNADENIAQISKLVYDYFEK